MRDRSRAPDVHVHIDRLVLDGVSLSSGQRAELHGHVERELTRLLVAGGLRPGIAAECALTRVPISAIHPAQQNQSPVGIGHQIARSLYGVIGGGPA